MIIKWLDKQINNVTQFNLLLSDTDFRRYSEAQNLTAKVSHRNQLREIVNQNMLKYSLKNTSWTDWANGNYVL